MPDHEVLDGVVGLVACMEDLRPGDWLVRRQGSDLFEGADMQQSISISFVVCVVLVFVDLYLFRTVMVRRLL